MRNTAVFSFHPWSARGPGFQDEMLSKASASRSTWNRRVENSLHRGSPKTQAGPGVASNQIHPTESQLWGPRAAEGAPGMPRAGLGGLERRTVFLAQTRKARRKVPTSCFGSSSLHCRLHSPKWRVSVRPQSSKPCLFVSSWRARDGWGLPGWLSDNRSACQCRRCGFDPRVRKSWTRK